MLRARQQGEACGPAQTPEQPLRVSGKTVLVGQISDSDLQPTPYGVRSEVELQASYVSDLLDGNYVRSVPIKLELLVLGLFILGTYVAEMVLETHPVGLALAWCGGFLGLAGLSCVALLAGRMTPMFLSVSWILCVLILLRVLSLLRRTSVLRAGLIKEE